MYAGKNSGACTFDEYSQQLQMVLEDTNETPVPVSLDYLKDITDGFSSERLIGRGGFGEVYRGDLGSGKFIAIKKLYPEHVVNHQKYQAELNSLIKIRHKNIALLIGYCAETKMQLAVQNGEHVLAEVRERLLCFEYISNGTLRGYVPNLGIFKNEDDQDLLDWDKRYAIIEGICRGLNFLHEECNLTHMDLKPENILMDEDMIPKITDFGLSRLKEAEQSQIVTQNVTGTLGYMPPEYLVEGKISHQTDIYSLGVITCEIITGEKMPFGWSTVTSMKFRKRVFRKWKEIFEKSVNDASLKETYIKQVNQLLDIALKCVDRNRMKRPSASEILDAVFNQNPASSCELNGTHGEDSELLSVHPLQLDFSLPGPKKQNRSSCSLHLTNNMVTPVAFRLLPSETLAADFLPQFGLVPPKCRYTLAVIIPPRRNPNFGNDVFFTIGSTKARVVQGLRVNDPEETFKRATEKGFKVQEVKLPVACAHNELPELAQRVLWDGKHIKPGLQIIPLKKDGNRKFKEISVHPTEPWIFMRTFAFDDIFSVWDYHKQEEVHFHLAKKRLNVTLGKDIDDVSSGYDGLRLPGRPKFISQKRWILVGSVNKTYCRPRENNGYIHVFSYMAMQNFKGSKTYLLSKIKSFKAHDKEEGCCNVLVEVHPSRPYVLSSVASKCLDIESKTYAPMDNVKVWDWEKGWDCVQTFNMEFIPRQFKFGPKDQDTFVTISREDCLEVWNIDSPECKSTFPYTEGKAKHIDFFTQGGKEYLIIAHKQNKLCTIWDYDAGTLVETLKVKNVCTACCHPELPVLITGCEDGRILLWSSSTFSLVGVLDCGLGQVYGVAGLKGSGRIVIEYHDGIAVAEIGHMMLDSETPH